MPPFFIGVLKNGGYTFHALMKGPSKTLKEMYTAQKNRADAFTTMMTKLTYSPQQIKARQEYWCSQTYFLAQLIKSNKKGIEEIISEPVTLDNETGLFEVINSLSLALEDKNRLPRFLSLLYGDGDRVVTTQLMTTIEARNPAPSAPHFYRGDVIELITLLANQGTMTVVDNAPNSHRDGAAKYSQGSVEELLSRHTDEALKMVLHFDDVHKRNSDQAHFAFEEKSSPVDVLDYQKRYLKMILLISANLIKKKESYLESPEFFNDLFNSFPNNDPKSLDKLPIYFGMQNNAYEVPVTNGFISAHWFKNTANLTTVDDIFKTLNAANKPTPILVASYAAPDLRKIETTPLDKRSTSNTVLQHPENSGTLGTVLTSGIAFQCQQAIKLNQEHKNDGVHQPLALVFVMPGCGAFKNPEKTTALHFISAIKYYYEELKQHNITCHIAEYNPNIFNLLQNTWNDCGPELGQFNEVINQIKDQEIRQKAIAVQEKICALYSNGEHYKNLEKHLSLAIQLLTAKPGDDLKEIADSFIQNAKHIKSGPNALWRALGVALMVLGTAVAAAGSALSVTGVGTAPGIGLMIGGGTLTALGLGLFAKPRDKTLREVTSDLVTSKLKHSP